jgi:hypothetical protein
MYSVPKKSADRPCHGKFKKLNLKVETKMVPRRKTIPSWTKFNKVQKIFNLILYSIFRGLHVLNLLLLESTVNNSGFTNSKLKIRLVGALGNLLLFPSTGRVSCKSKYPRRKVEITMYYFGGGEIMHRARGARAHLARRLAG